MIEGFLKYRKIRKKKDIPGPGTYHHDNPKDYLSDDKNLKITAMFQTGKIDRFGDYKHKKHNERPNLGPG